MHVETDPVSQGMQNLLEHTHPSVLSRLCLLQVTASQADKRFLDQREPCLHKQSHNQADPLTTFTFIA